MKKYSQIEEGLYRSGKSIKYNPNVDKDFRLDTHLGKKGFQLRETTFKDLNDSKVYSIYSKLSNDVNKNEITYGDVLKTLKSQSDYKISNEDIDVLLNRAAILTYDRIEKLNIDVFVTIESSSQFSTTFLKHILKRYPYEPVVYLKGIKKNKNFNDVYIQKEDFMTDKFYKELQISLERMKNKGYINIKNFAQPQFRKFLKNWLILDESFIKHISNKNICVIDDYFTSGSSMYESIWQILQHNPKSVCGLTLIKG